MKQCAKCKRFLPATTEFFHRSHIQLSGLHPRCKDCRNAEKFEHYWQNRDEAIASAKEWQKKNHERHLENVRVYQERTHQTRKEYMTTYTRNRRAKLKQIEGFHNADDIQEIFEHQNGLCFYCKKELVEYDVDHFIPITKGGSNFKDNLVIACPHCNRSKGAKLPQDFMREIAP